MHFKGHLLSHKLGAVADKIIKNFKGLYTFLQVTLHLKSGMYNSQYTVAFNILSDRLIRSNVFVVQE